MSLRPVVRPGALLLRRDAAHLQVGTSPGIVVADRPGLRTLLALLDGVRDVAQLRRMAPCEVPELDVDVTVALEPLLACGAVIDAAALPSRPPQLAVAVHHDVAARAAAATISRLLCDVGVRPLDGPEPELLVVVTCGEPARAVFDEACRRRVAHLVVVLDEDRVRVGPLVLPGRTPCLTCLDLHRTDWDRAWPALLPQLGRRSPTMRVSPASTLLQQVVATEVTAEVLALAGGARPRTCGQVLALGPRHDDAAVWPLAFHHGCGCALLPAA